MTRAMLSDVRDFRTGEFVSAADLNYLRDVLQTLRARRAAHVYRSSDRDLGKSSWESIEFAHSRFNKHRLLDKSDPTKLNLTEQGLWLAGMNVELEFASTSSSEAFARILRNGHRAVAHIGFMRELTYSARLNTWGAVFTPAIDDYLEAQVWQNAIENQDINAEPDYSPSFWALHLAGRRRSVATWTTPPAWVSGSVPTAAQMDQIGDDIRFLDSRPYALVGEYDTVTALPASTVTSIPFDLVRADNASFFSPSSATRLTIPQDGIYLLLGCVQLAKNSTASQAYGYVSVNGSAVGITGPMNASPDYPIRLPVCRLSNMTAGDYVQLQAYTNAATGSGAIPTLDHAPALCAVRLGANTTAVTWPDIPQLSRLGALTHTHMNLISDALNYLHHPPVCALSRSTSQTVTNGNWTSIVFASEQFDTDGMHSTVSNTERITFNDPGIYIVGGSGSTNYVSGTGGHWTRLLVNGTTVIAHNGPLYGAVDRYAPVLTTYKASAGDYVEVQVYSNQGVNTSTVAAGNGNWLFAIWAAA